MKNHIIRNLFIIFCIIFVLKIIGTILYNDYNNSYYICTDVHNKIYYVRHILTRNSGDYIKLEDNTILRINSYKRISKEEYETNGGN